jgi:hypothetical protein
LCATSGANEYLCAKAQMAGRASRKNWQEKLAGKTGRDRTVMVIAKKPLRLGAA